MHANTMHAPARKGQQATPKTSPSSLLAALCLATGKQAPETKERRKPQSTPGTAPPSCLFSSSQLSVRLAPKPHHSLLMLPNFTLELLPLPDLLHTCLFIICSSSPQCASLEQRLCFSAVSLHLEQRLHLVGAQERSVK